MPRTSCQRVDKNMILTISPQAKIQKPMVSKQKGTNEVATELSIRGGGSRTRPLCFLNLFGQLAKSTDGPRTLQRNLFVHPPRTLTHPIVCLHLPKAGRSLDEDDDLGLSSSCLKHGHSSSTFFLPSNLMFSLIFIFFHSVSFWREYLLCSGSKVSRDTIVVRGAHCETPDLLSKNPEVRP